MKAFVLPRPSLGWVVWIEMSDPRGAMSKEKSISHSLFIKGLESGCLHQFALSSPFHSDHYIFCPAFFSPNSHTETTKARGKLRRCRKWLFLSVALTYWAAIMINKATKKYKSFVWNHLCPLYGAILFFFVFNVFCSDRIHNYLNDSKPVSVIMA